MSCVVKYFFALIIFFISVFIASAQSGDPIYIQTFGEGDVNLQTTGPPVNAKTDFIYTNNLCPSAGSYNICRNIDTNTCTEGRWINLFRDDGPSNYGMFMLINNNYYPGNRLVYMDTTGRKNFCAGTVHSFLTAIVNISNPSYSCGPVAGFPILEFRIEDDKGNLINKDTVFGITYAQPAIGNLYNNYGLNFTMPANVNRLVMKITLIKEPYSCGEDFAIDDVIIRPAGPEIQTEFADDATITVKSVCYQQNKIISMKGSMQPYYPNPALQWQQSVDSGLTWTDIAGATGNIYSATFSTPDTFLFRLTGADASAISNPNCRVVSNTIKVEVDGLPSNFKITNNSPVCAGQDLQFNATGGASYVWNGPDNFYDNIPFPHIPNVSLEDSGTYNVQITSLGGCTATTTTHVTINGIDVKAGPDTSICNGSSVILHVSAGKSYAWSPADGLSNNTIQNPKATPTATTTYIVNVTSADGCSDTAKATVTVTGNVPVKANFTGNKFLCLPADTATFTDMSSGDITSWQWNFGNGETSNEKNPPPAYYYIQDNTSTYTVSLKVTDSSGCRDSAYQILRVESNCYIAVPSAFTPNGDGLNDYLYVLNAYKATNLTFRIYNRFGGLMFETKDWTRKWDGTKSGIPQQTGTYIWMLDYTDANNKKVSLRGTTVLLR